MRSSIKTRHLPAIQGDRPDVMRLKEQLLVDREGAGSMPALTLAKRRIALSVKTCAPLQSLQLLIVYLTYHVSHCFYA